MSSKNAMTWLVNPVFHYILPFAYLPFAGAQCFDPDGFHGYWVPSSEVGTPNPWREFMCLLLLWFKGFFSLRPDWPLLAKLEVDELISWIAHVGSVAQGLIDVDPWLPLHFKVILT